MQQLFGKTYLKGINVIIKIFIVMNNLIVEVAVKKF